MTITIVSFNIIRYTHSKHLKLNVKGTDTELKKKYRNTNVIS
jgi:hypothetical protein